MYTLCFVTVLYSFFFINHCFYPQRRTEENELNLNESFFPSLKNYHVNGEEASERRYPWIARVIHSQSNSVPLICTAVCIAERIFITAARCIYVLKVVYTSIIYQKHRLPVKALVMPSNTTKQLYDDIGFIIVKKGFYGTWKFIKTFNAKRTDNAFIWFEDTQFNEFDYKVVGYAMEKDERFEIIWTKAYKLMELEVVIDIELCREILPYNRLITGFNVPCYHSCSLTSYLNAHHRCKSYHGVLGGAVINFKDETLIGITTWAATFRSFELPVGFAVPNSESYFEDRDCSIKIRNDNENNATEGHYQRLCDNKLNVDE